jgi:hypothetical protein
MWGLRFFPSCPFVSLVVEAFQTPSHSTAFTRKMLVPSSDTHRALVRRR